MSADLVLPARPVLRFCDCVLDDGFRLLMEEFKKLLPGDGSKFEQALAHYQKLLHAHHALHEKIISRALDQAKVAMINADPVLEQPIQNSLTQQSDVQELRSQSLRKKRKTNKAAPAASGAMVEEPQE